MWFVHQTLPWSLNHGCLSCFLALLPCSFALVGCLREVNVANFFARGLVGVDKHLFQMVSLVTSMTQIKTESNFLFYYSPMSMLFRNKNNKILSKTRRKISSMSSITKLNDSTWCVCFITRCQEEEGDVQLKISQLCFAIF